MVRVAPVWPKAGGAIEEEIRAMWVSTILPDMARGMVVKPMLGSGKALLPVSRGPAGVAGISLLATAAETKMGKSLPRHVWLGWTASCEMHVAIRVAVAVAAGTVLHGAGQSSLLLLLPSPASSPSLLQSSMRSLLASLLLSLLLFTLPSKLLSPLPSWLLSSLLSSLPILLWVVSVWLWVSWVLLFSSSVLLL